MRATSKRTCRWRPRRFTAARLAAALVAAWPACPHAAALSLRLEPSLDRAHEAGTRLAADRAAPLFLRPASALTLAAAPHASPPVPSAHTFEEMLLEVDLNEQDVNKSLVILRRDDGLFYLAAKDLGEFHLITPSTAPLMHGDTPYFPLDTLAGARFSFDESRQRLEITANAEAFTETLATAPGAAPYPKAVRASPGGFLNYAVNASQSSGTRAVSGAFEAGFFNAYGVVTSGFLVPGSDAAIESEPVVRLDTTYTRDWPDRHQTLHVGDAISRGGTWGRPVRFGGVQFGTNFSTEPGFVTFPTHAVAGRAVVPSVVDVYVNNALIATREVRPGPFSISNIPFISGSGNVRLVVRDLQGRELPIEVSQPFYSANNLLRAGLDDYSFEIGAARNDFAIASNHYSDPFASGTWRRGLSDTLTAELRGEAAREQRAAGAALAYLHPRLGVFDFSSAMSNGRAGTGELVGAGYQRQGTVFTVNGLAQWTTPGFRQTGLAENELPPRQQVFAGAGVQMGILGSANVIASRQRYRDRADVDVVSATYSRSIGSWANLSLTGARTNSVGTGKAYAFSANLTVPLGPNLSAAAAFDSARSQAGTDRAGVLSLQRNRGIDDNYSYRLEARRRDIEGILDYRTNTNNFELGVARSDGNVAARAQVAGGIGFVGSHPFLSRFITGSFGVVKVADYPNVGITFDNQFAGKTDANGYFVLPELRAYDRNPIGVRQADLPLDATVASLRIDAAPYYRSGVLIEFPVKHARAGTMHVHLEDGSPLPSGALVSVPGEPDAFPTALHGEVYLSGLGDQNKLQVTWKGQRCLLDVAYPKTEDPLPELGTFVCKGVKP